ncbi:hypothetical protein BRARA_J00878 [Brassica rapa]|uniref:Phytocyanin domain-containing protein n=1 Tax=Brassica campestris TaxID=3711 RepID=M4CFP5_BRACM|nr:early nodulin-like protein 2 [Brassica rapa]RID40870.1 hypothetical protein BRARA_J00878 [Brassica rapa]
MVALMKNLCFAFVILTSFATLFSVADARRFYVGGSRGWVMNPRENYNTWAERNRFQVNDTLYFKYAKGSDSVQQVMKADYYGCNVRNPLEKFDNGETEVALNRSGPFYFISGNQDRCLKGQKLIVVVLAIRHPKKVPISPAKPPSTTQPPQAHSPGSPVAPAMAPSTPQPPKSHSPVSPVAPAKGPSSAESPKAHSPVSPPAKAPSTTQPPKAHSPVSPIAPATAPSATPTPDHSPASPAPENTPPSSPAPPQSTPADNINAPAASTKNAASVVAVTSVMTTVLSVAFTVLMFA